MEMYIPISYLNDFIFCPRSIYNHQLYQNFAPSFYQENWQREGTRVHEAIDNQSYSTHKNVLQNFAVYSHRYRLFGKLDIYHIDQKKLVERKREIKTIYDGYIMQLYAQYFALQDMGYVVQTLQLYDYIHNRTHAVPLPEQDPARWQQFELLIKNINDYQMKNQNFIPNEAKCNACIYHRLCDKALC